MDGFMRQVRVGWDWDGKDKRRKCLDKGAMWHGQRFPRCPWKMKKKMQSPVSFCLGLPLHENFQLPLCHLDNTYEPFIF